MKIRDMVEDIKAFDEAMRVGVPSEASTLVYDNRSGEYWDKLVPKDAGDVDEIAADAIYIELTQEHFDELEAARAPQNED